MSPTIATFMSTYDRYPGQEDFERSPKQRTAVAANHGLQQQKRSGASDIATSPVKLTLGNADQLVPPLWVNAKKTEAGKCAWLRSQLVGRNVEFTTPLGIRRLLTYADHTASGQALHHVEDILSKCVLPFYGNTHTEDSYVGKRMSSAVQEAGAFIKHCLGGTQDEAIMFCGSGTTAALKRLQECMGIVVPSCLRKQVIHTIDPDERWVVFVGPYEHHSNLLSWRESLAEVIEIPVNEDGSGLDMHKLRASLQDSAYSNRPKIGSFTAASNVTGTLTDTRAMARLLHQHGAFACFDFAASGPYVKIDMRAGQLDGYDALVLSPHKFVGGPGSPGILLMSKELYLLKDGPPSTCGGGTVEFVNGYSPQDTLYTGDIEHREDAGTPPILQKVRAALAFWVKDMMGYDLIETREQYFITTAIRRLLKDPYVQILGNTEAKRCAILSFTVFSKELVDADQQLVGQTERLRVSSFNEEYLRKSSSLPQFPESFDFDSYDHKHNPKRVQRGKPLHCRFVVRLLNDLFGIQARAGCACAGPYGHYLLNINHQRSLAIRESLLQGKGAVRPGWARLSFCYYTSNEEFEFILSAIQFLAEYGQRFLPLYDFNWRTGEWTCKSATRDLIIPQTISTAGYSGRWRDDGVYMGESWNSESDDGAPSELGNMSTLEKYNMYLDVAKTIAKFLDKFPEERDMPPDIDPRLIDFRI